MQKFWRGGIQWCCKNFHSALALEDWESSGEATVLLERWVAAIDRMRCAVGPDPLNCIEPLACCTAIRGSVGTCLAKLVRGTAYCTGSLLEHVRTPCVQIEFLRPMTACILSERRTVRPFGMMGGGAALAGVNLLLTADGRQVNLGGKNDVQLKGGDRLRILTPGGVLPST